MWLCIIHVGFLIFDTASGLISKWLKHIQILFWGAVYCQKHIVQLHTIFVPPWATKVVTFNVM